MKTFMDKNHIKLHGDAFRLQQMRRYNYRKLLVLKKQNIIIRDLKCRLLKMKSVYSRCIKSSYYSTFTSPPSVYSVSSCAKLFTYTEPSSGVEDQKLEGSKHLKTLESGIVVIDMFLKAIYTFKQYYRRVILGNFREVLIRASTLPAVSVSYNLTATGFGLVPYADRLLNAAYLEGYIDRCLEIQSIVISEATVRIPLDVVVKQRCGTICFFNLIRIYRKTKKCI